MPFNKCVQEQLFPSVPKQTPPQLTNVELPVVVAINIMEVPAAISKMQSLVHSWEPTWIFPEPVPLKSIDKNGFGSTFMLRISCALATPLESTFPLVLVVFRALFINAFLIAEGFQDLFTD